MARVWCEETDQNKQPLGRHELREMAEFEYLIMNDFSIRILYCQYRAGGITFEGALKRMVTELAARNRRMQHEIERLNEIPSFQQCADLALAKFKRELFEKKATPLPAVFLEKTVIEPTADAPVVVEGR